MKLLTTLSRIFVGVLFIISGLIKSNDPIGFGYKLEEYYQVFAAAFSDGSALQHIMIWLGSWTVLQAMLICIVEVILGVFLLLGHRVKLTLWLLLAMIVFFTFLTFYSAYYNKVTDCGCFGDAVKLTPWESFTKDIVLLVLILILLAGKKYIRPVFGKKLSNAILVTAIFLNILFPIYTWAYLPVIDFRPYAVGNDIKEGMNGGRPGKYDTKFIYKNLKTGKDEELDQPPYTDTINWEIDESTWQFVDQKQIVIDAGEQPPIHDFSISNVEDSDYTEDILNYTGYQFFLVSYDLEKACTSVQSQINDFATLCEKDKVPFIGLTAAAPAAIDEFRHEVNAMYDYYITDATQLKTMIRSNPGLILLKGSKVIAMWPHRSFPSYDAVKREYFK